MPIPPRTLGLASAAMVAIAAAGRARNHQVGHLEEQVFRRINAAPEKLHAPAWVVMQSGSLGSVVLTSGVSIIRGRSRTFVATLIPGVAVWLGVKAMKRFVGRDRPSAYLADVTVRGAAPAGLGFPSGHSAVAMTLALVTSHEAPPAVRLGAIALAGATGTARVYVGAHLPLDVVEGLAIGVMVGSLVNRFAD